MEPLKLSFQWAKEFPRLIRVWNNLSFLQERENFERKNSREWIHLFMPSPCSDHLDPPYSSAFSWTRRFSGRSTSKSPPPYILSHTWPTDETSFYDAQILKCPCQAASMGFSWVRSESPLPPTSISPPPYAARHPSALLCTPPDCSPSHLSPAALHLCLSFPPPLTRNPLHIFSSWPKFY